MNKDIIEEIILDIIETIELNSLQKNQKLESLPQIQETKELESLPQIQETKEPESLPQKLTKINTLCFSGGGIKGIAFIGALENLLEKKIFLLEDIKTFVGTSAGSMLSFLLNIGWKINEIKEFMLNFNFEKLISEIDSVSLFETYGIQDGNKLQLLFIKLLENKFQVKDITFEDLYRKTHKKLIIIGTNLTKSQEVVFNYKTTPKFSVILALRISSSIPLIFKPIKYENELYVDGGIVNNFPLNHCSKNSTIGFYIKNSDINSIKSITTFIISVLNTTTDTISQKSMEKYKKNVIEIINTNDEFIKFNICLEERIKIIEDGYNSCEEFIKNYYHANLQTL
jgi:predicted acylesterase/phospholipase RssA